MKDYAFLEEVLDEMKALDGVEHVANYVSLDEAKGQAKRFTKADWAFLLAVAVVGGAGKVIYRRHAKKDN